jgi:hypothetical protein
MSLTKEQVLDDLLNDAVRRKGQFGLEYGSAHEVRKFLGKCLTYQVNYREFIQTKFEDDYQNIISVFESK